ncbi:MAG: hypothetical protein ACRDZQ_00880 [Acidimicrobiales bacterium]
MLGRWARRVRGLPASANGASSLHLWWHLTTPEPLVAASVTIEVLEPPAVDRLYFWALQVGFHDGRRDRGAGHTGLQWLPAPTGPPRAAVNWGGYRAPPDGGELEGTASDLPSLDGNANTRLYPWVPGGAYRLAVSRSPRPGSPGWRATVTDEQGVATVIRDLHGPGAWLTGIGMWSEVFARCDDPRTVVRWSRPRGRTEAGEEVAPAGVAVTYQSHAEGGCANTNAEADEVGIRQVTAAERTVPHGAVLDLPTP